MKIKIILCFIIVLGLLFTGVDSVNLVAQEDVVVVVNNGISSLSRTDIKNIFTGRVKYWPGGGPVKVLLNSNESVYNSFCQKYLGISSSAVDGMWVTESIKNGVAKPRKVPSSVVVTMVANSNQFIGFVERSKAAGVKVID